MISKSDVILKIICDPTNLSLFKLYFIVLIY